MTAAFRCLVRGRAAADALAQGRVLAVFGRSFYVESRAGALACLGPEGLGPGPLTALYALPPDWSAGALAPDDPVVAEPGAIVIAGRFRFATDGREWRPPMPTLPLRETDLAAAISRLPPGGGFHPVLADTPETPLIRAARPGIDALAAWLRAGGAVPERAADLLGLGPGLTPSGDDLVGGILVTLRATGREADADALARWALPRAETRTSRISLAHLRCAATGEGAGALHDMLAALGADDPATLDAALRRLAALGHSSGWDALAGAALVLRNGRG